MCLGGMTGGLVFLAWFFGLVKGHSFFFGDGFRMFSWELEGLEEAVHFV